MPTRAFTSQTLARSPRVSRATRPPGMACSSPTMRRRSVDLPEPFGPTTAQLSPARTVHERSRRTGWPATFTSACEIRTRVAVEVEVEVEVGVAVEVEVEVE